MKDIYRTKLNQKTIEEKIKYLKTCISINEALKGIHNQAIVKQNIVKYQNMLERLEKGENVSF